MKKILTITLALALTVTGVQPVGINKALAAEGEENVKVDIGDVTSEEAFLDNLSASKGVYWFDPHEVGTDLTDTFIYDEDLLKGDSLEYNQSLATMTFELAVASISSEREPKTVEGYANKSRNLRAYLEDNGFVDFDTNEYYKQKMTTRTMGVGCAHKKIVDDGKEYTLIALVPRSAGYESEWGGNFMIGGSGDHQGFKIGKDIVLSYAREYIEKYSIEGDIKIWTSGYSRGAGVTNQVGAELIRNPEGALGEGVNLEPQNLYCYTFGTPRSADVSGDYADSKYAYIHNTLEHYDIVTVAPPAQLGFERYGTITGYADRGDKERMLSFLKQTNETVYNIYTNGGDPDGFTPKMIDVEAMTKGELKILDDEESYLPEKQAHFMKLMEDSLAYVAGSRQNYYETYQDALEHLCGYFFSHIEYSGKMIDGIKSSEFLIPMAVSMYVSFIAERYGDKTFTPEAKAEMEKALQEIENLINNAKDDGIEIPEEVAEQYEKVVEAIKAAKKFSDFEEVANEFRIKLYSQVIGEGLTAAGLSEEDPELYAQITSEKESGAISKLLTYLMLYDKSQKEEISFDYLNQQFKHFATFIGNAASYMRPHNNEIILSWLKTLDSNYNGMTKENASQIDGYDRLYIKPSDDGAQVVVQIKDEDDNIVATFEDGELTYRSDSWIGYTTSDDCGWLRIPAEKGYTVSYESDVDTEISTKTLYYNVASNTAVSKDDSDEWVKVSIKGTISEEDETKEPATPAATESAAEETEPATEETKEPATKEAVVPATEEAVEPATKDATETASPESTEEASEEASAEPTEDAEPTEAAETEVPTEETEEPSEAETDAPKETEKAKETDTPASTDAPAKTNAPVATPVPGNTATSSAAKTPTATAVASAKVGDTFTYGDALYEITAIGVSNEVKYVKYTGSAKTAKVPATVEKDGVTYSVTAIGDNAFKGCKKLTKIVIGKNVKSLGNKLFAGCNKVKKVIVKTKMLTGKTVAKKAFKGLKNNKNVVVKVPSKKKKAYKKLFKKKGLGKKVTVK
ncbi:MAG: leucine-rich repeat protein [Lachnospiraceae bacterium]|nr:leucine-rich repeat protein [Lachnospiraceae bacterium]